MLASSKVSDAHIETVILITLTNCVAWVLWTTWVALAFTSTTPAAFGSSINFWVDLSVDSKVFLICVFTFARLKGTKEAEVYGPC